MVAPARRSTYTSPTVENAGRKQRSWTSRSRPLQTLVTLAVLAVAFTYWSLAGWEPCTSQAYCGLRHPLAPRIRHARQLRGGSSACRGKGRKVAPKEQSEQDDLVKQFRKEARSNVQQAFKARVRACTLVLPLGVEDGLLGSTIVRDILEVEGNFAEIPFRVMVAVPEQLLDEMEVYYLQVVGSANFIRMRAEGASGVDEAVSMLTVPQPMLMYGSYADVERFCQAVVRSKRSRKAKIDLAVFEYAHLGPFGDKDAAPIVLDNWQAVNHLTSRRQLFITQRSLGPVVERGLAAATSRISGPNGYRLANPATTSPYGVELLSESSEAAREKGVLVPVKLLPLGGDGTGLRAGDGEGLNNAFFIRLATKLAEVKHLIRRLEVPGLSSDEIETFQDVLSRKADTASITVVPEAHYSADVDALLLLEPPLHDEGVDLQRLSTTATLAVSRISHRTPGKEVVHVIIPSINATVAKAAWQAIMEQDASVRLASPNLAVAMGYNNGPLAWQDIPHAVRSVVVDSGGGPDTRRSQTLAELAVYFGLRTAVDEWFFEYGCLKAYCESRPDEAASEVPPSAVFHDFPVGLWLRKQYAATLSGRLPRQKLRRLTELQVDYDSYRENEFWKGLEEYKNYEPTASLSQPAVRCGKWVPPGTLTSSGFPVGAWLVSQQAAWKRGELDVPLQYALFNAGIAPVPHPDDNADREQTTHLERILREHLMEGASLDKRVRVLRSMLSRFHPENNGRNANTIEVMRFLLGYWDWFLDPPELVDEEELIDEEAVGVGS